MTKVKAQISNECQMTNAKISVHPLIQTQPTLVKMHNGKKINVTQVQSSMVHGSRLTDENSTVLILGFWI